MKQILVIAASADAAIATRIAEVVEGDDYRWTVLSPADLYAKAAYPVPDAVIALWTPNGAAEGLAEAAGRFPRENRVFAIVKAGIEAPAGRQVDLLSWRGGDKNASIALLRILLAETLAAAPRKRLRRKMKVVGSALLLGAGSIASLIALYDHLCSNYGFTKWEPERREQEMVIVGPPARDRASAERGAIALASVQASRRCDVYKTARWRVDSSAAKIPTWKCEDLAGEWRCSGSGFAECRVQIPHPEKVCS